MATIQIDGPKRLFYLKSTQATILDVLLRRTNDTAIYDLSDGELSIVNINPARLGIRVIRIFNLLPEMPADAIHRTMGPIECKRPQDTRFS